MKNARAFSVPKRTTHNHHARSRRGIQNYSRVKAKQAPFSFYTKMGDDGRLRNFESLTLLILRSEKIQFEDISTIPSAHPVAPYLAHFLVTTPGVALTKWTTRHSGNAHLCTPKEHNRHQRKESYLLSARRHASIIQCHFLAF